MAGGGDSPAKKAGGSGSTKFTVADLIALRLRVQRGIGSPDTREQVTQQIDALKALLDSDPNIDISNPVSVIDGELAEQPRRYIPLATILIVIVGVVVVLGLIGPAISEADTFLGYNLIFVLTSVGAGFLGSFVRVLNRVVSYEYSGMSRPTVALVMLLRPLAGAALGLFVAAVFAAGGIATPVSDTSEEVFAGITKGGAFVFAVAFIAGLVDDFALNVADRFAAVVRTTRPESEHSRSTEDDRPRPNDL